MPITSAEQLYNLDPSLDRQQLEKLAAQFSISITDSIWQGIENGSVALRKQFIPTSNELTIAEEELGDPINDLGFTKVPGIVHRHDDRVLLKPLAICPVYCRFCFRRELLQEDKKVLTKTELAKAYAYIRSQSQIWEVILTGGDPLMLNKKMLKEIILELSSIEHVKVIRIHTRIPIVDSKRVDSELLNALTTDKALFIVLHSNHSDELNIEAQKAIKALVQAGIPLLSQTVLLKGINDNAEVLEQLFRRLVELRVKPYYLHHGDLAKGTSHFRTSIAQSRTIWRKLVGRVSGLCLANLMLDLPGGFGKVPINHNFITKQQDGYQIEDYQGKLHMYKDTRRPIRSFVRRETKMTDHKKEVLSTVLPQYRWQKELLTTYVDKKWVLEIGFGNGDTLFKDAEDNPERNFIGAEVYLSGVVNLLRQVDQAQLTNLWVWQEPVEQLLALLPNESLARVQIFFPDPWPKKRHHKRRLLNKEFLALLSTKLTVDGELHIASDWADYIVAIEAALAMSPQLVKVEPFKRHRTKYETRGLELGHSIVDFCYRKVHS